MSNCKEKQKSQFKNVQKSFQHILWISLLGEHSFASGAKLNLVMESPMEGKEMKGHYVNHNGAVYIVTQ